MHAEKCPVCNGNGTIDPLVNGTDTTTAPMATPCHGCGGKGWVEVSEEYIRPVYPICPRQPYGQPYYPPYPLYYRHTLDEPYDSSREIEVTCFHT